MIKLRGVYGDDLMVVNFARESTGKEKSELDVKDIKFINYLAREQHIAPFFHPKVSLQIDIPFFLARQWERHRIGTSRLEDFSDTSELSRRYVDTTPGFYNVPEWHLRPEKSIKQGSGEVMPPADAKLVQSIYDNACRTSATCYKSLLHYGVAPEEARMVLLVSAMTRWTETASLHFWARFCDLRCDSHAQSGIRHYANEIDEIMDELFPHSWAALRQHGPTAMKERLKNT